MNELKCKNCGKSVEQTPNKRAKEFCNVTCRSGYWQKQNRLDKAAKNETPAKSKKKSDLMKEIRKNPITEKEAFPTHDSPGTFMGHEIPKGLKGIDLSIWKSEIKEKLK